MSDTSTPAEDWFAVDRDGNVVSDKVLGKLIGISDEYAAFAIRPDRIPAVYRLEKRRTRTATFHPMVLDINSSAVLSVSTTSSRSRRNLRRHHFQHFRYFLRRTGRLTGCRKYWTYPACQYPEGCPARCQQPRTCCP